MLYQIYHKGCQLVSIQITVQQPPCKVSPMGIAIGYSAIMSKLSYAQIESSYGQSTHREAITATIRYPGNTERQPGYVAYLGSIRGGVDTQLYYYHAPAGLRFPYTEAYNKILSGKEQDNLLVQAARYQ